MKPNIQKRCSVFTRPGTYLALAVVVLLALLVAYVGVMHGRAALSTSVFQPQPTSVHIMRIPGNEPNVQIVPLDRTITDKSQAQRLYDVLLALPPANLGSCAARAVAEAYVLTFYRNGQSIVMARAGFCPGINVDRGHAEDTLAFRERLATPVFWTELAHVLGMPPSDVEPVP